MPTVGYIHIGAAKTGTTSIQRFLADNRSKLVERRILYPISAGEIAHHGVFVYARDPQRIDAQGTELGIENSEDHRRFCETYRENLIEEINSHESGIDKIVLSSELIHSRLADIESIERLRSLLEDVCDKIKIIAYLRRQDLTAISLYHTRLKAGGTSSRIFPWKNAKLAFRYNYADGLDRFASVFGQENLLVRIFERSRMIRQDLCTDFWSTLNDDPPLDDGSLDESLAGFTLVKPLNQSLPLDSLSYLRMFNLAMEQVPTAESAGLRAMLTWRLTRLSFRKSKRRNDIWDHWRVLDGCLKDVPHTNELEFRQALFRISSESELRQGMVSRADAESFYERFRDCNETVRSRFFPQESQSIFSDDFSSYPEAL